MERMNGSVEHVKQPPSSAEDGGCSCGFHYGFDSTFSDSARMTAYVPHSSIDAVK
jgi:hypothetical protein